ncbi:MAG: TerD family protein [Acidimicrobiales bacterium]
MGVSLSKGQRISLAKEGGGTLSQITMGLGWDVAKPKGFLGKMAGGGSIDLDASCMMFDASKTLVDQVWFKQLKSRDGSVVHTGDNLTGAGEGDDESMHVDLSGVPAEVAALVFVVNSFTGQSFAKVENAFCRVVDRSTGAELFRYDLSGQGDHTAQIMVKVYRHGSEWKIHAIGENTRGRTFKDLLPAVLPHL